MRSRAVGDEGPLEPENQSSNGQRKNVCKHFIDIILPNAIHATSLELPLSVSFSQALGTATSTLD
jgi:hypothetical protein